MSISPPIRALSFFNYLWPFLMMAWLSFAFLYQPLFFTKPNLHQLITYLFFIYTIFIAFAFSNGFIGNRFLEYFQIFIFYWAYCFNSKYGRVSDNLKLLYYLMPVVVITSVVTIIQYISNPNISRTAKKDTANGIEQMSQGVAGYEFIYFLVFISIVMLFLVTQRKKQIKTLVKGLLWFLIILFAVNIALSNFMIALLFVTISLLFRVFIPKISALRVLVYIICFLVISPFLPYLLLGSIDFALSLSGSSMNAQRLLEMRELLVSGLIELSLGARLEAFQSSLYAFVNNPIMGIITSDIGGGIAGLHGFGQHSFLLDTFALYGGIIGVASVYIYSQPLVKQIRRDINGGSSLPFLMLLLAMLFFIINNMTPSIGFAIYFAFPVLYGWLISPKE